MLHVIDARTFEKEEIIRMPTPAARPVLETMPIRPRSTSPPIPPSVGYPSAIRSSPPPRIVVFSGALEDTFRISSTSETRPNRRRAVGRRLRGREEVNPDEDVDGIVVIPPLGDPQVEDDVRRLFNQQGLRTRSAILDRGEIRDPTSSAERDRDRDILDDDDAMDVDEPESDCFSSHTPSRAPSPSLPQSPSAPAPSRSSEHLRVSRPGLLARRESSGPYSVRRLSRRARRAERVEPDVDVDLAGTCFDPTGSSIYVASVKGVAEWTVRGAEQRWWTDPEWA